MMNSSPCFSIPPLAHNWVPSSLTATFADQSAKIIAFAKRRNLKSQNISGGLMKAVASRKTLLRS